jgi:hypothetical protein
MGSGVSSIDQKNKINSDCKITDTLLNEVCSVIKTNIWPHHTFIEWYSAERITACTMVAAIKKYDKLFKKSYETLWFEEAIKTCPIAKRANDNKLDFCCEHGYIVKRQVKKPPRFFTFNKTDIRHGR